MLAQHPDFLQSHLEVIRQATKGFMNLLRRWYLISILILLTYINKLLRLADILFFGDFGVNGIWEFRDNLCKQSFTLFLITHFFINGRQVEQAHVFLGSIR